MTRHSKKPGSLVKCQVRSQYPICSIYKYDGSQDGENTILGRIGNGDVLIVIEAINHCYHVYCPKIEKTGYIALSVIEDYFHTI